MANVRAAVLYSSVARLSAKLITLATMMVVSRLLTPSEIGTYAIAASITMVTAEFRSMGAGNYLIREAVIDSDKIRKALGLTILISWGLGFLVVVASEFIAAFYKLPELSRIFLILSISFFVAPFITIPTSLLSRNFNFKIQLKMNFVASVLCSLTTISFVLSGFSFYSLALGQVVTPLTIFFILLAFRPEGMRYIPLFRGLGPLARFGAINSITLMIRKANVTLSDVVIGKLGPTRDVALFSRGMGLIEFLSQTVFMGVRPVVLPHLAAKNKEGGDVTAAYTRASVMLGAVVVPILGVASVASLPVIRFFFGNQWDASAPVASLLAIWAMFRCAHWLASDALMAVGRESLMLIREGVPFLVLLPSCIFAYPYGLDAVAAVFIVSGVLDFLITTLVLKKALDLRIGYYLTAWWSNIFTLLVCLGGTWLVKQWISFTPENGLKVIGILALIMPPVWLASLKSSRNPLYFEIAGIARKIGVGREK